MVTPVFRISDYPQALAFYIDWLGFRIDWEEQADQQLSYLQVSRGDIVLHLTARHQDSNPGSWARAEMRGLPAYHHQLLSKDHAFAPPGLAPAYWNERVLEMEVVDPFGNHLIFCEAGGIEMG